MRRKDREITDRQEIAALLDEADVCRVALITDGAPYIVPLNYGYEWDTKLRFYFHSAREGRKLDLVRADSRAGFEIDGGHELMTAEEACSWSMKFRSIIGTGRISEITEREGKKHALDTIMAHFHFPGMPKYSAEMIDAVTVLCLEADEFSCKAKK